MQSYMRAPALRAIWKIFDGPGWVDRAISECFEYLCIATVVGRSATIAAGDFP